MKPKLNPIFILISILVMVSLACSFGSTGAKPAEPTTSAPAATITLFDLIPKASPTLAGASTAEVPPTVVPIIEPTSAEPQLIRQWASSATASSSYSNQKWSPSQATGEPNVDTCGDNGNAWASFKDNTAEWIELTYDMPVVPTEINIYQSYNPSQVVEVQMTDLDEKDYAAWSGEPEEVATCPDLMTITLELDKEIKINKVTIFVDQSKTGWGWNEIDAVELVGYGEAGAAAPTPEQQEQPTQTTGGAPVNISGYPYKPDDLTPGSFSFDIKGAGEDATVGSSKLQYQSTSLEYIIGLLSQDDRYALSLFLPLELKEGTLKLNAYNTSSNTQAPGAAIYIRMMWLYVADSGELVISKDPSGKKLTGVFRFTAHNKDDPTKVIEVVGALNDIPIK